jgi:hypothetical protein
VSSLVDQASSFDADVAQVKRALFRSRRIIASTKQELDTHERWLGRHNLHWQEDLEQHQRFMRRWRAIWFCKRVLLSLILLVSTTCRAILSGAFWFLNYSSRLILIRSFWLAKGMRALASRAAEVVASWIFLTASKAHRLGQLIIQPASAWPRKRPLESGPRTYHQLQSRIRKLDKFRSRGSVKSRLVAAGQSSKQCVGAYLCASWKKHAAPGPSIAIAAITLVAIGAVSAAKPMTPVEVVLPILADTQGPVRLTALSQDEVLRGHRGTSGPSPKVAPGFARVLFLSVAVPEPLPLSGKDIASMMLLMTPLPASEAKSGTNVLASAEITEPRPQPHADTPRTVSRTRAVAPEGMGAQRAAPAVLRRVAENPEARSKPPATQRRPTPLPEPKPTQAGQRRDFVPNAFW